MKRLTKIDKYGHPYTNENVNCRNLVSEDGINYQYVGYVDNFKAFDGKPIEKLSKIEDIETELGIPLEVLFKALKEGIYWDYNGDIITFSQVSLDRDGGGDFIFDDGDGDFIYLKNYKKTWWLKKPKEELENAKD